MVRLSRAFVAERDQRRSMTTLAAMTLLWTAVVTAAFTEVRNPEGVAVIIGI